MADVLTGWLGVFLYDLTWERTANIFLFAVMLLLIVWLVAQSVNKKSDVHLADLLLDPKTRRIGTSHFRVNGTYIVVTVAYLLVVISDKAQFIAATTVYAGLWVVDRARNSYFEKGKPNDTGTDKSNS
jgi:hypothetical protein